MEIKNASSTAAVLEVLDKDNYVAWSLRVKTYLKAHDLWDIIKSTKKPRRKEGAAFKAWSKKNSKALHVIQISCGPDTFFEIIEITSAKIAWDTLAEKYNVPKNTNSGYSMLGSYASYAQQNNPQIVSRIHGSDRNGNDDFVQYEALKKAVQRGDWNAAEEFLKRHPGAKITYMGETALHVAVHAGHEHIVEKLVDLMSEEDLAILDTYGSTALSVSFNRGNYRMAACMVRKNKNLLSITDSYNDIPVNKAIFIGHIELACYLYSLTPLEDLIPEKGIHGATLCTRAINSRSLNIALDLIQRCPRLVLALDIENCSPLYALASMPNAFPSGDRLVFWKRWIYSCIHIQPARATEEIRLNIQNIEKGRSDQVKIIGSETKELGINGQGSMEMSHFMVTILFCCI